MSADTRVLTELVRDMIKVKRQLIGRLAERGYQLLRDEVPKRTRNLQQGVSSPVVNYEKSEAVLTVSARSAAIGGQTAKVIGADGKEKKSLSLRPRVAYNYAEVVAMGNRQPSLTPQTSKAFLIPVPFAPAGGYLLVGGQVFIVRRRRKGQKPNPFHERAGARLEKESRAIADAVLAKFFQK